AADRGAVATTATARVRRICIDVSNWRGVATASETASATRAPSPPPSLDPRGTEVAKRRDGGREAEGRRSRGRGTEVAKPRDGGREAEGRRSRSGGTEVAGRRDGGQPVNLYPRPWTVTMCSGIFGLASIFCRRPATWTSTVRVSGISS